jgi:hypothetical protein
MAKPRVFISSTYYDLKHLRSSIENFIDQLGYEAVLSEKDNIAFVPDLPLDHYTVHRPQKVFQRPLITRSRQRRGNLMRLTPASH